MVAVVTFGTFDLMHVGHVRLLEKARSFGDSLIVYLSSDELNLKKKNRKPVYPWAERAEMLSALSCVDDVRVEESLEDKVLYVRESKAAIIVMGDDWSGRFDKDAKEAGVDIVYVARTPEISTTQTVEKIQAL